MLAVLTRHWRSNAQTPFVTSPWGVRLRRIVVSMSVCLPVCLFSELAKLENQFFSALPITVARSSSAWQRCDVTYTSGFVDDAMFARNGPMVLRVYC